MDGGGRAVPHLRSSKRWLAEYAWLRRVDIKSELINAWRFAAAALLRYAAAVGQGCVELTVFSQSRGLFVAATGRI